MTFNKLAAEIHKQVSRFPNSHINSDSMLMGCHSELTEAWEELRSGHAPDEVYYNGNNPKPEGFPVELADAIMRILDLAAELSVDIDGAIQIKMAYNETRLKVDSARESIHE